MSSVFTKIINRVLPAYIVAEDNEHIAFLDINPIAYGHLLVVPKLEVDYIFDIEDPQYIKLFSFAKKVSLAMKKAISCQRISISVIGTEVPHAHIHLIPTNSISDVNFEKEKLSLTHDNMVEITEKIKKFI
ncbi:MAG: HIT family protein [Flavobacteriales bacterium]|nr:HIT family protein [Flavobacteriales bacterium]|tara:strand:- start:32248 stop:32640 length:393 start_codon:yes stop_codon:yes gene_type:complete